MMENGSQSQVQGLFDVLCEDLGVDLKTMIEPTMANVVAGLCPDYFLLEENGICRTCGGVARCEPDQDAGWCEECESGTIISGMELILRGAA
ncbi:MAG: hypothetical protein GY953_42225 [bacterium]|nr:hypothetical protein [bacterium]